MTFKFDKEKIKKESLAKHKERSKLFKENRFMFELQVKQDIDELIESAPPEMQKELRDIQVKWNAAMKDAGEENRLMVAANILTDNFINKFSPAMSLCFEKVKGES